LGTSERWIYTSTIAPVEVLTALYRKGAEGDLRPGGAAVAFNRFQRHCEVGQIRLVAVGGDVIHLARPIVVAAVRGVRPVMLRALDTIHVASAQAVAAEAIVTADVRMRQAEVLSGMQVIPATP
jgi:predicted nucleic acid-binding protein